MTACRASLPDAGTLEELVAVANAVADSAAVITTKYFRTRFEVDVKSDASPVTIADRQAERAMREALAAAVPGHCVFGEEEGFQAGQGDSSSVSDYLWVLDPIDGTKSFITGKPVFGTLVSLLYKGAPVIGILDQPVQGERWVGVSGRQTTLNGIEIHSRACGEVSSAYLYATTPHMFEGKTEVAFNALRDQVRIPLYGCDCYAYGLLAAGHCDLVAEADLKPVRNETGTFAYTLHPLTRASCSFDRLVVRQYDYMALVPIVSGAGGTITDWKGGELLWSVEEASSGVAPIGEVLAAGDASCHAKALGILGTNMK